MREADVLVEPPPPPPQRRRYTIPGGVKMRRVEADPPPRLPPGGQRVAQRPQLLERAPERRSRARRSLDQHAHLPRDRRQTLGVAAGVTREPGSPVVDVVEIGRAHV